MFQPRYIKHSHLLIRHAEKLIRYRRDRLSEATIAELRAQIEKVHAAMKARDNRATHEESERLDALLTAHTPPHKDAVWRENVEVILVAIVVAIGIRSYFIQPFKIPTGSMQPTLNGIIGQPSTAPAPNFFKQIVDFVVLGRNYIDVVSGAENTVSEITPRKVSLLFHLFADRLRSPVFHRLCAARDFAAGFPGLSRQRLSSRTGDCARRGRHGRPGFRR